MFANVNYKVITFIATLCTFHLPWAWKLPFLGSWERFLAGSATV